MTEVFKFTSKLRKNKKEKNAKKKRTAVVDTFSFLVQSSLGAFANLKKRRQDKKKKKPRKETQPDQDRNEPRVSNDPTPQGAIKEEDGAKTSSTEEDCCSTSHATTALTEDSDRSVIPSTDIERAIQMIDTARSVHPSKLEDSIEDTPQDGKHTNPHKKSEKDRVTGEFTRDDDHPIIDSTDIAMAIQTISIARSFNPSRLENALEGFRRDGKDGDLQQAGSLKKNNSEDLQLGKPRKSRLKNIEPTVEHVKSLGLIDGRWKLTRKLGQGGFGLVCEAVDINTGQYVAIKVDGKQHKRSRFPPLVAEQGIYLSLRRAKERSEIKRGHPMPPGVHYRGLHGPFTVLVMDRLGSSLHSHGRGHGFKMPVAVVMDIGIQIMDQLEALHDIGLVHCDLKPGNIVEDYGEPGRWHLIDFGITRSWFHPSRRIHVPKEKWGFTGTTIFADLDAHRGFNQSRKSDIESLIYVLIYLLSAGLPWMRVRARNEYEYRRKVYQMKEKMTAEEICKDVPDELCVVLEYSRRMPFASKPSYGEIRELFQEAKDRSA